MVSPANTYPGLTKPGREANEPNVYYPNGKRNYAGVVPADDLQGTVAANKQNHWEEKVYILDDQELYGKGLRISLRQLPEWAGSTWTRRD